MRNVFVGPIKVRGLGIVPSATRTNANSYWDTLTIVGGINSLKITESE